MESAFDGARVTGYEALIPAMTNDHKDRHVLAAAVRCKAHAILTTNVKDFPRQAALPYDVDVLTPDTFLVHQFHLAGGLLEERLREQAQAHSVAFEALVAKLGRWAPTLAQLLPKQG